MTLFFSQELLGEIVSVLNIMQTIYGGRPGMSSQLDGPSAFLIVPVGGWLISLFWEPVPSRIHGLQGPASTKSSLHKQHNAKHV